MQLASEDQSDLSAKIYLSSTPATSDYYPRIPPVASVLSKQIYTKAPTTNDDDDEEADDENEIDSLGETSNKQKGEPNRKPKASVELWWNPAPTSETQPAFLLEYCLVISTKQHYRDNCLHHKNVCELRD